MQRKNETAALEVRRDLKEKIRDDWTFQWPLTESIPPAGASTSSYPPQVNAPTIAPPPGNRLSEAIDWRERCYASSDTESDLEAEKNETRSEEMDKSDLRSAAGTGSMYQFESPDTVGVSIEQRRLARKRKRRKVLEEEMQWNTGLAYFTARRDAWTGARAVAVNTCGPERGYASASTMGKEQAPDGVGSPDETASPVKASTNGHYTSRHADAEHASALASEPEETEVIVPVFPPLVPNTNPIRASITPATYPSLYSKIVMQSLTPSIPINLSDIVRACVRGWQEAGEWPPKGTPAEVAIARRRHAQQIDGLIGLDLGEKEGEKDRDGADGKDAKEGSLNGSLRRKGAHLRKGVAQVKKVFRLSGGSFTGPGGSDFG